MIVRILAYLGLPTHTPPRSPHGDSIYSKRPDPQPKTGPAIAPTIRLGRHSRRGQTA